MKIVIQRVKHASVTVNGKRIGEIEEGLLLLIGVAPLDTKENANKLIKKCLQLRIFNDDEGKMNRSVTDISGGILLVSQFTLYGDCKKGTRPSFTGAAAPDHAEKIYNYMISEFNAQHPTVQSGQFAADMKVELLNDGPVTLILEN